MKICYLKSSYQTPDLFGAAWCRVFDGDTLTLAQLNEFTTSKGSKAGIFPYDFLLFDVTGTSLDVTHSVRQLLESYPSTKLVLLVAHSLPEEPDAIKRWTAALSEGDLILAPQYTICVDILRKTGLTAYELLPPQLTLEEGPLAPEAPRRLIAVVTDTDYSHRDLIREIGIRAYLWIRLRFQLIFARATAPMPALLNLIRRCALVYLPESIEDGGALAAACASAGTILIAPHSYDPARLLFPLTTLRDDVPKHQRASFFFWLHGLGETAVFFRQNARRAAEQLRDENRRVQFFRRVQYRFPEYRYFPKEDAAPSLLDQIHHRSGPIDINYGEDECLLVCLVRNGQEYIPSFLDHYRTLGVRHFVFIDNGSDDNTLALIEGQDDVTTYETSLPHKHYENEIRRLVIEQHCRNRFCLNVDIDELFDYPMSDRLRLPGLLDYLRRGGFTAMAGYMLDMYAKENVFGFVEELDLKSVYPYYDISNITKYDYYMDGIAPYCNYNVLSADHVKTYFGGIRKTIFGEVKGPQYLLTKHPLLFLDGTLDPVTHPDYSNKAKVADVTCVLYHYKFTPSFKAKVSESYASRRYVHFAQNEYDCYHTYIGNKTALSINTPGTRYLRGTQELVEQGFIAISSAFEAYVSTQDTKEGLARQGSSLGKGNSRR